MFHKHGGDIYSYDSIKDFSANINFRGMPETVRAEAVRAVDASVHYPDPEYRALRMSLARRENLQLAREYRLFPETALCRKITPEQIICGNGAAELMFSLVSALKPRHALLAAPSFYEYEQALESCGCQVGRYYLKAEQDFRLDEAFVEAIGRTADMVILGSPNNPTGQLIDGKILRRLIRACREKHVFIVLDESFFDFLTEEDRMRTIEGVREVSGNPNLFIIRSFTKMYAMPGLRFGYGICSHGTFRSRRRRRRRRRQRSLILHVRRQRGRRRTGSR